MLIVVLSLFSVALWQYGMLEMRRVQRTEETPGVVLGEGGGSVGAWKNRMVKAVGGKIPFPLVKWIRCITTWTTSARTGQAVNSWEG